MFIATLVILIYDCEILCVTRNRIISLASIKGLLELKSSNKSMKRSWIYIFKANKFVLLKNAILFQPASLCVFWCARNRCMSNNAWDTWVKVYLWISRHVACVWPWKICEICKRFRQNFHNITMMILCYGHMHICHMVVMTWNTTFFMDAL